MLLVGVVLMLAGLTLRGPASIVSTHEIQFDPGSALMLLGAVFIAVSTLTYVVQWTIGVL